MPANCLKIIESKSKVRQTRAKAVVAKVNSNSSTPTVSSDIAELKDTVRALLLDKKKQYSAQTSSPTPAPIKAVEPNCVTCGGMDECLALADLGASINLMPLSMWKGLSLSELTPTCMTLELVDRTESKPVGIAKDVKVKVGMFHFPADFVVVDFEPDPRVPLILESDFLLFEEANAFLGLEDDPDSSEFDPSYYDPKGDILSLEAILNSDLSPPLLNHEQSVPSFKEQLKACKAKTIKSSIDEPLEVELKDLPPHLEYAFLEGDNKLSVIIA
nr:reverse transcriptase domain-containing protein [Tanacetum cinerariifolium]